MVKLSVEIEESFTNSVQEGWIVFTKSPEQYEVRSNYGPKWFELAWKQPAHVDACIAKGDRNRHAARESVVPRRQVRATRLHIEVQVGAASLTGIAAEADALTLPHFLPDGYE